jgi:hypothetical protein
VAIPPSGGTLIGGSVDSSGGGSGSGVGGVGSAPASPTVSQVPGVSWLGGGNIFEPTPINPVDSGGISGTLPLLGGGVGSSGDQNALGTALAGAGIGVGLCTAGLLGGATAGLIGSAPMAAISVTVNAPVQNIKDADELYERFQACVTRYLARVMLDQMTASIVSWINSGFEGKPSFVTNYQQFFTNVADQAAGEFIRGSALSFLCSPFQPQVRIAIAQSYARRGAAAPSCSLTQVTNNIDGFLRGNFSQGGWPAFISFTTTPTNNPYGAYMYGQTALNEYVSYSVDQNRLDVTVGQGFLSQQKCDTDAQGRKTGCKITTPGQTINDTLATSLGTSYRQLELADNFDEIISAFVQQLLSRTLYGGLSSVTSASANVSSGNTQLQQEGQALLTAMQAAISTAQQHGYAKQGSISDIQNAQQQLQNLANCHIGRNNSSGEQQALAKISELESRVAALNTEITRGNTIIANLQQMQTRVLSAATLAQIQTLRSEFTAAQASGAIITAAQVTQAQQDRSALQAEMASLNQQTAAQTDQCYAGT